jgi:hypothetical protein
VARERRDDVGLRGPAAVVPMLGEVMRVAPARDDVAGDAKPRDAGDVADDQW